jgi:hypothetical protein
MLVLLICRILTVPQSPLARDCCGVFSFIHGHSGESEDDKKKTLYDLIDTYILDAKGRKTYAA